MIYYRKIDSPPSLVAQFSVILPHISVGEIAKTTKSVLEGYIVGKIEHSGGYDPSNARAQ